MTRSVYARVLLSVFVVSFAVSCSDSGTKIDGYDELVAHVASNPIGHDADAWIEYKNMAGEWEKTGLIFGYIGDFEECQKAIAGFKAAHPKAEYRCVPANEKKI
ncbi:MAG: hypothetical protein ABL912_14680 [Novosphingobium sp.]